MLTATTKAPAIALPMVTGIRFLTRTSKTETGAPAWSNSWTKAKLNTEPIRTASLGPECLPPLWLPGYPHIPQSASSQNCAPERMPAGKRNMLVTECSKPMATNMEMGNQAPIIFPPSPLAMVHSHMAMQTNQLHIMPLTKVGPNSAEHFLDTASEASKQKIGAGSDLVIEGTSRNRPQITKTN